jgi:hypothetical protein
MKKSFAMTAALVALASSVSAQGFQRRATMTNHASGGRDKCTIEVVVDGAAEVEIRGDSAVLRNISGQPPQWRRFECSAPMPSDAVDFRFQGVDGRGRQQLLRDPRGGGPAVVRIDDPDSGAEGYTFDITWSSGAYSERPPPPPYTGDYRHFTREQAVDVCRDAVRQQAMDRFRTSDIRFRQINTDDNRGRNDGVIGVIDVRFGYNREEPYRFSCSVNFETGRVRSAEITRLQEERGGPGPGPGSAITPGIDACQRAVEDRLRTEGYDRISIRSIRADDRPGGTDRVLGSADAEGRYRRDAFDFSCAVNLERGVVRGVDVTRR